MSLAELPEEVLTIIVEMLLIRHDVIWLGLEQPPSLSAQVCAVCKKISTFGMNLLYHKNIFGLQISYYNWKLESYLPKAIFARINARKISKFSFIIPNWPSQLKCFHQSCDDDRNGPMRVDEKAHFIPLAESLVYDLDSL